MKKASQRHVNHAALNYLNLWAQTDAEHLERFLETNARHEDRVAAVHAIASKYRVARGFSKYKRLSGTRIDPDKNHAFWEEVLLLITAAPEDDCTAVEELAAALGQHGRSKKGKSKVLRSAASKLLWFAGRYQIRIYDGQALAALGWGPNKRVPYHQFQSAWNAAAQLHAKGLDLAVAQLQNSMQTPINWSAVRPDQETAAGQVMTMSWFRDRVFDQVLWNRGKRASNDEDTMLTWESTHT
jgi:hypothetical protein